jgi:hypothetical protein
MQILVSDTSVLIDLERAGFETVVFSTGHTLVVPDLLYRDELADYDGQAWLQRGLQVVPLDEAEVSAAQGAFQGQKAASLNDCFSFSIAQSRGCILLTGDAALRRLAEARGVECHGILWIADVMADAGVDRELIERGLTTLLAHPRCRLPREATLALIARLRP